MQKVIYLFTTIVSIGISSSWYTQKYPFSQEPLHYALNALQPAISKDIMDLHFNKHHAGYIKNANSVLEKYPQLHGRSAHEVYKNIPTYSFMTADDKNSLNNNLGGHINHAFFWHCLRAPQKSLVIPQQLKTFILKQWQTIDAFLDEIITKGLSVFGSGWVWVVLENGSLKVITTRNQDHPVSNDPSYRVLLGIDVWEHAYYLDYKNDRKAYLSTILRSVVNWDFVAKNMA